MPTQCAATACQPDPGLREEGVKQSTKVLVSVDIRISAKLEPATVNLDLCPPRVRAGQNRDESTRVGWGWGWGRGWVGGGCGGHAVLRLMSG